ncbi:hypothetical protein TNCV_2069801 [Trichonephila clavipes]|uniref:Uncharacterized protein n=1 Tax=Trichonephila clavipes TaxID=2585209 RepID=A0A8X7BD79_TRICX|nr:hypothetical protein TNCV_2069801 [Trichonephila clavipes]
MMCTQTNLQRFSVGNIGYFTLGSKSYTGVVWQLGKEGENESHVAEITNGVYGPDTVAANYVQFWFRRLRPGTCILMLKMKGLAQASPSSKMSIKSRK